MTTHNAALRLANIRLALDLAFAPTYLELIDDSASHAGHPGAQAGKGHYLLTIASTALDGLSRIEQHKQIYEALGKLMETDIHALSITVKASGER